MVSKVAVIALVAIIACPILLGYGLNLSETTETRYRTEESPTNVTPLLRDGIAYSYANGDIYTNNTNFSLADQAMFIMPIFNRISSEKTSLPMNQVHFGPGTSFNLHLKFQEYSDIFTYMIADYIGYAGYMSMQVYNTSNTLVLNVDFIHTAFYDTATSTLYYSYYPGGNLSTLNTDGRYTVIDPNYSLHFDEHGGNGPDVYLDLARSLSTQFVDFSAGFYFGSIDNEWNIKFPNKTKSILISLDLDSITASTYTVKMTFQGVEYVFNKTTTDGVVSWQVVNNNNGWTQKLYYDNLSDSNTYQIYFDFFNTKNVSGINYYESNAEFRYIGPWNTLIGESNYYQKYTNKVELTSNDDTIYELTYLNISNATDHKTPTMRVDRTEFRALEYSIILDKTYYPSHFKGNPITTITNITKYGTSITFGGNTYIVSKGNITLEGKSLPIDKLDFSSTPSPVYGYVNKIGNTVISETVSPSEIVFNGEWSASVITDSMEAYTYTNTEWVPGKFSWNGIDDNFLLVGLLASIGVFIALGVHMRNSRASVWPLLIVCAGAALLFILMM